MRRVVFGSYRDQVSRVGPVVGARGGGAAGRHLVLFNGHTRSWRIVEVVKWLYFESKSLTISDWFKSDSDHDEMKILHWIILRRMRLNTIISQRQLTFIIIGWFCCILGYALIVNYSGMLLTGLSLHLIYNQDAIACATLTLYTQHTMLHNIRITNQ